MLSLITHISKYEETQPPPRFVGTQGASTISNIYIYMPNIYTYYCQTRCKTDFEIAKLAKHRQNLVPNTIQLCLASLAVVWQSVWQQEIT